MRRRGRKSAEEQAAYEAELEEMYDLYEQGWSLEDLCEEFGYAHQDSISSAFTLRGWYVRTPAETAAMRWSDEDIETLRKLAPKGMSALREALSLTDSQIRYRAKTLGIQIERPLLEREHGNWLKYEHEGCRCAACREANTTRVREYRRRNRGRRPYTHGASGYITFGCRCEVCRAWQREQNRRARAKRKQAAS